MADSSPERALLRSVVLDAGAAGFALGAVALGGGSLVLYESSGLLVATAGLIASLVLAMLVGMWASDPGAEVEEPPVRERDAIGRIDPLAAVVRTAMGERVGHAAHHRRQSVSLHH